MRPLLLLALITPSARSCFDTTRGGCFTAGFVDNLSSAEDCQAACAFDSACEYFAYHSARGDRRCHFCHDDRDVSQCAANVNNPSADARWRDCVWGPVDRRQIRWSPESGIEFRAEDVARSAVRPMQGGARTEAVTTTISTSGRTSRANPATRGTTVRPRSRED